MSNEILNAIAIGATEALAARDNKRKTVNAKFVEVAKILGFDAIYFSGTYRVKLNGAYIGQMSAEAWLDHIRNAMTKSGRC